jgi:hypothetical protein
VPQLGFGCPTLLAKREGGVVEVPFLWQKSGWPCNPPSLAWEILEPSQSVDFGNSNLVGSVSSYMKWLRLLRRVALVCLLVVCLVVASAVVFERIQFYRAQRMLTSLRSTAVRGVLRDAELDKYLSEQKCTADECTATYELSDLPFPNSDRWYPILKWLGEYWPQRTDWTARATVTSINSNLISRRVDIVQYDGQRLIVWFIVVQTNDERESHVDECIFPEVSRHQGYVVTRPFRYQTLYIRLRTDAAPQFVDRAFELRISCLHSPDSCERGDAIAPRASEDFFADARWRLTHQDEVHRIWKACDARPAEEIRPVRRD